MGFFSKIFKGVKKVFKKIGRGIKKIAGKIGKFMGKLGIVGQIAMSFILPGLGGILGAMTSTMMGSANAVISGMGNFLNGAINIATKAGGIVKDIGSGIVKVVGKTIGATINAIPGGSKFTGFLKDLTAGKLDMTADSFLGKDGTLLGDGGVLGTVKSEALNIKAGVGDLFSMDTLKGKNVYADKYEKDLINEAFDPSELGDIGSEGGRRSMIELDDPRELAIENLRKSGGTAAKEASLTNPRGAYFDELRQGVTPDAVTAVADGVTNPVYDNQELNRSFVDDPMVSYVDKPTDISEFGTGINPNNVLKKKSLLEPQSISKRFLNSEPGQRLASTVQTKFDEVKGKLTASNIASGIYKTYGQPPEVEESYAGTYGSSYKAPVVEQYEVAGASTIQNFAQAQQPLQISGYNNIYNPLATPQSSWARTFGQLTT